jgi:hypothetical protein
MASSLITRRSLLGTAGAASLAPVLPKDANACTGQQLAPAMPHATPAFTVRVEVGAANRVGTQPGLHHAFIHGGDVTGPLLNGKVQGGRVQWHVDAANGQVEITARFAVLRADGMLLEVRDCARYPASSLPAASGPIATAPVLMETAGELPATPALLVGRLDASQFANGVVLLHAFEVS